MTISSTWPKFFAGDALRAPSLRGWVSGGLQRVSRLALALVPLLMLLVGSCKTAELPGAYGGNAGPEQFRLALFPDQVRAKDASRYAPARGYVRRAQTYVAGTPDTLALLTQREVSYLFGAPSWQRRDPAAQAQVWQYSAGECVVDFYFYEDGAPVSPPVSYADIRQRRTAAPLPGTDRAGCLKHVMSRKA